ncbi:MAG: zinc ribbon domain-containing protein [Bacteroidales bacterium]|nr:zinc ribbon domain-containing protein [Bacteroidales bacterium]
MKEYKCPNCGAPITSEKCPYCGNVLTINSDGLAPEYPVIKCKSAHLTFFRVVFPAIFFVAFGLLGVLMPLMLLSEDSDSGVLFVALPFGAIGLGAFAIMAYSLWKYLMASCFGKKISGVVCGYVNDEWMTNGVHDKKVKILVDTKYGKRFIYYSTGGTEKKYAINSSVDLKVYKNIFLIIDRKVDDYF